LESLQQTSWRSVGVGPLTLSIPNAFVTRDSSGKLQGTGEAGGAMFLFFALHLLFFLLFGLSWLLEKPLPTATKPAAAAPKPSVAAGPLPKSVGGKGAKSDSGKGKKA
jgi:hypothetical protein